MIDLKIEAFPSIGCATRRTVLAMASAGESDAPNMTTRQAWWKAKRQDRAGPSTRNSYVRS